MDFRNGQKRRDFSNNSGIFFRKHFLGIEKDNEVFAINITEITFDFVIVNSTNIVVETISYNY